MKKRLFDHGFILVALIGAVLPLEAAVPNLPSRVTVRGHQLIVEKRLADGTLDIPRPYVMKGVNWNSATRAPTMGPDPTLGGQLVPYGFFFDGPWRQGLQGHDLLGVWTRSEFTNWAGHDIPLIQQMNANTVRVFTDFGTDPAMSKALLDSFYQSGIMVIMTIVQTSTDVTSGRYLDWVRLSMNHPAILMWTIGNEWNLNGFYGTLVLGDGSPDIPRCIALTQQAATGIKGVDSFHPVSSSLGDIFSTGTVTTPGADLTTILAGTPAVDLWSLNSYHGQTFASLFQIWSSSTTLPFFLGEFGIDSFNTTAYSICGPPTCQSTFAAQVTAGFDDQATQAAWDRSLLDGIAVQLSAFDTQKQCIGGNVFNFNDNLYEVGDYNLGLGGLVDEGGTSYNAYNDQGFYLPGASQDDVTNEEHFGLVDANRLPKAAYRTVQSYYQTLAPLSIPVIGTFNPPSATAGGTDFVLTVNGSNFTPDCFAFWNGNERAVSYINSSQLQINVTSSDLAQARNVNLFVVIPSTTGSASALATFPIQSVNGLNAGRVSPNPWRKDRNGGVPVTFDQLTLGSQVKIYTLDGHWIRTLQAPSGFVNWDLHNDSGDTVASGIYLYVLSNDQGQQAVGKLAVIH